MESIIYRERLIVRCERQQKSQPNNHTGPDVAALAALSGAALASDSVTRLSLRLLTCEACRPFCGELGRKVGRHRETIDSIPCSSRRRGRARRSRAAASSTVPARSRRRARPRRSPLPTKAAACTRGVERCRGSAEATRRRRRDRALTCSRRRGPGRRAPGSCDSTRVEATRLRATPLARLRRVR